METFFKVKKNIFELMKIIVYFLYLQEDEY